MIPLGVLIPLMCLLLIVVPLIVIAVVLLVLRLTKRKPEWEINPDEVELGEPLGMGGYGSVYKARWRGTEVAVKMLPSHNPSKEMIKNFCDEVRLRPGPPTPTTWAHVCACCVSCRVLCA